MFETHVFMMSVAAGPDPHVYERIDDYAAPSDLTGFKGHGSEEYDYSDMDFDTVTPNPYSIPE